jgi:ribosomal protein S18 acetylase RimI-like enzyme
MTELIAARFPDQLALVQEIFSEYAASLGVDLSFQDFDAELAALPGKYASPKGCILLAFDAGQLVACGAMRPIDDTTAEMKRLYVRPAGRGQQLGRRLAERLCELAREAGYLRIRLDTLPEMKAAQQLYASLGFTSIPPYVFNPVPGTQFLQRELGPH